MMDMPESKPRYIVGAETPDYLEVREAQAKRLKELQKISSMKPTAKARVDEAESIRQKFVDMGMITKKGNLTKNYLS